jgi:HlyD family secretion protein
MRTVKLLIIVSVFITSCNKNKQTHDASGTFEAEEIIIASEASGVIKKFDVQEGQSLKVNQDIGFIDTTQLYLKKKQVEAQIKATLSRRPDISAQIASLQEQLRAAERDQKRFNNLLKQNVGTQKQLDDINTQVEVIKKQIAAQQSALGTTSESITRESNSLQVQIQQLNDQLEKCRIINPVEGTVLTKYAEANEVAVPGKPLYKIANLSTIILRAYITGDQISQIKLDQKVKVLIDNGPDKYKEYEGVITWISDQAEFTPKTIQTKDERANLVYAMKINVKNDGYLKLGMYGEVAFNF